MKKLFEFLRIKEWFASKCGLLAGIALFEYWKNKEFGDTKFIILFFSYVVFITFFLAFGYVINDYCDREIDRQAGKKKIIADLPQWISVFILWGLIFVASIPILCVGKNRIVLGISIILTFFAGMTYSAKPFRFKERGIWGLMISSIAQRCMPLWVLYELSPMELKDFILWECVSLFLGLRYILIHQRIDACNDIKTGTVTFATTHYQWVKKSIYVSFVLELVFLSLLLESLMNWKIFLFILIYGVYLILQIRAVKIKLGENAFLTFSCVPLEEFYNFCIPVGCAVLLSMRDLRYLVIVAFFLVVLGEFIIGKCKFLLNYMIQGVKGENCV